MTNASQMWIKRSSLLKAFSNGLIEFFLDVAHMDVEAHLSDHVDIVQVAKNDEMTGKVELMKLLLAASINSKDKQTFIEIIMGMEDDKQEQLMYVIQEFSTIARPIDDEEDGDHDDAREGAITTRPGRTTVAWATKVVTVVAVRGRARRTRTPSVAPRSRAA